MPKITPDVTLWLTDELHKMLTKVILAKQNHPRIYWLQVQMSDKYFGPPALGSNELVNPGEAGTKTIDLSGKVVTHTTIVIMEAWQVPPVPMLSTSLWRIDNKIGEAKCIYILPPDKPIILGTQMGESSKFIWKSAKGAPLVYSSNN